jgi:hypothetical protein
MGRNAIIISEQNLETVVQTRFAGAKLPTVKE